MSLLQRLLRVVPATVIVGLAYWGASLDNDDYCGTVGECLGTAFDDALVLGVGVLLGPALLWAARLPRVMAHSAALLLTATSLWFAAGVVTRSVTGGGPLDDPPLPLPVALAVAVVAALVATYAAGPGGRVVPRLAVLALSPVLAVGTHLVSERVAASAETDRLAAAPVTLYAPVISGHPPERASVVGDEVNLSWSYEVGDRYAFVYVTLTPAPHDEEPGVDDVVVVRGDTVLVADFDAGVLDPDEVRAALEVAPVVDPDGLAG